MKKITKIILINIILLITVVTISFFFFDLSATNNHVTWQGQGYYRFDNQLGFTHKKSIPFDVKINDQISYRGEINRYGFRGNPFDLNRESIYLAGDSQIFGWGLNEEETISSHLDKLLQQKYNIINAGVAGYGTDQSYERFLINKKTLPSLKYLFFFLNNNDIDHFNNVEMLLYQIENGVLKKETLENSFDLKIRQLPLLSDHPLLKRFLINTSTVGHFLLGYFRSFKKQKSYRVILTKQLENLAELAKQENFQLILIELPNIKRQSHFQWLKENEQLKKYYFNYNQGSDFSNHPEALYLSDHDHLSVQGSKLLAQKLKKYIEDYSHDDGADIY